MVDTINPNTNEPDSLGEGTPIPPSNDGRFYGGFDKPDETKINLADAETTVPNEEPVVQPVSPPQQPVGGVTPVKPAEVKHTSYVNTANMVNWRGLFVIALLGLVVALILGAGLYFGISYLNNSKIAKQEAELDSLNEELSLLDETPNPLELPEQVETPAEETPVVVPPVVTPTPIETEETEVPDDTNNTAELG